MRRREGRPRLKAAARLPARILVKLCLFPKRNRERERKKERKREQHSITGHCHTKIRVEPHNHMVKIASHVEQQLITADYMYSSLNFNQ
jgi:hypothetical protein